MATARQLKALRRKHHLGEFRHKRKVYKHKHHNYFMAKKRRGHSRRSYGGSSMKGVWSQLLGVGAYVLFESYLEPMIPLQEPVLTIAEIGVSYWMSKKGGFVGDLGKAGVYINSYQLIKYFASSTLPSLNTPRVTVTDMFAY